jgi:hypothetical protein
LLLKTLYYCASLEIWIVLHDYVVLLEGICVCLLDQCLHIVPHWLQLWHNVRYMTVPGKKREKDEGERTLIQKNDGRQPADD